MFEITQYETATGQGNRRHNIKIDDKTMEQVHRFRYPAVVLSK